MPEIQPSEFYVFDLPAVDDAPRVPDVVAFTGARSVDVDALQHRLRAHLERSPPPGQVYVLASETASSSLTLVESDEMIRDVLAGFTQRTSGQPIVPLVFTEHGELKRLTADVTEFVGADFALHLLRSGLLALFSERGGLLEAGVNYHWVNPSGVHTTAFIRAGEVLRHSAEVAFVAMGLLGFWRSENLRHIYIDTASISSVAYALVDLKRAFKPGLVAPTINSFSSYDGVKSFGFRSNGLCLISASISGGLEDLIASGGNVKNAQIVTLFYGGPRLPGRQLLCDLVARDGRSGIKEIECYREPDCPLCHRESTVVHLSGDQFLPASPRVSDVLIRATHAPAWLPTFVSRMVGQRIVRCHAVAEASTTPHELYVHVEPPEAAVFMQTFGEQLTPTVPVALTRVIHSPDPSSKALAETLVEHFERCAKRTLPADAVMSTDTLSQLAQPLQADGGTIAVVSSVLSTGRLLLSVSQRLREASDVGGVVYVVGVARMTDEAELQRVRSSLTWSDPPGTHKLVLAVCGYLPRDPTGVQTPWQAELGLLDSLAEKWKCDTDVAAELAKRSKQLRDAERFDQLGLVDDVFLPRVTDSRLVFDGSTRLLLRPTFALWPDLPQEQYNAATQADVYLTVCAVLHALRCGHGGRPALVQHEHNRTVLSPDNFKRYNDGVLQAALLRAARPAELDFEHDEAMSAEMLDLVLRFVDRAEYEEGEAAPEFLLAIALGRLRLKPAHTAELANVGPPESLPPLIRALRRRIAELART